jgi:hypothetical protein
MSPVDFLILLFARCLSGGGPGPAAPAIAGNAKVAGQGVGGLTGAGARAMRVRAVGQKNLTVRLT